MRFIRPQSEGSGRATRIPSPPTNSARGDFWDDLALLALIFGVLYFYGLGETTLVNPDEGRYAEIPREMVANNDFVTPHLNGVVYFEKPPLVYWIVAVFLRVFGSSELALRAVPALFGIAGVLMTYGAARRLYGRQSGLAAALVLGTSLLYFAIARILLLDMAVSVLISATLFCFALGVGEPVSRTRRVAFYGLYVTAALATLAKGLVGFLLPGAVIFFWLLIFDQWKRLRPFYLPTGTMIFLLVAVPWHIFAAHRNPAWMHFYFVHEHWERFTTTEHGRYQPWWFFIPVLALGLFPWTGCLWPALRGAIKGGWANRKENSDQWFFISWAGLIFVFFSKSQSKLIPYILPVITPLAVLIGRWVAEIWQTKSIRGYHVALWTFTGTAGIFGTAILVALFVPGLTDNATKLVLVRPDLLIASLALLAGALLVPRLALRGKFLAAFFALSASVVTFYLALGESQDKIARPGTKELALVVKKEMRPHDRVYHYHEFFHDFTFYAEQTVGVVAAPNTELEIALDPAAVAGGRFIDEAEFRRQWEGPDRLWIVTRRSAAVGLLKDATFRHFLLGETSAYYLLSNRR